MEIVSPARMELPPPDPKSVMMVRGSREKKQRKSGERAPRTALPGSPPTESRLVSLMPSIDSNSALATASSTSFANLEIRLSPPPPPKQEKEISIRLSPPPPIQEKEITITEARKLAREWCNKIMEKGAEAIGTEFKPAETTVRPFFGARRTRKVSAAGIPVILIAVNKLMASYRGFTGLRV